MASNLDHHLRRRHHHHHHRENNPLATAISATSSCCCGCGSSPCCTESHLSSPPPAPAADHLLQLLVSYLQQQQQERRCCDQTHFCETSYRGFNGFKRNRFLHQQKNVQREYDHFVLSCLLRRIDDLESTLHRFSVSSDCRDGSYCSLRDSAARVIQAHFRAYLVHRSRSLRQLKELATIKSSFLSLKSSVSGKTHVPFEAVSREAMGLLLQLDSIQGSDDPMIRDGKRSLSRELVSFLKYVDGCAVKKLKTICKSAKNASFVGSSSKYRSLGSKYQDFCMDKDRTTEKLRKRIEKIFISPNGNEDNNVELDELHRVTDDGEDIPMILVANGNGRGSKSRSGVLVRGDGPKSGATKTVRVSKNENEYQVYGDNHERNSSGDDDSVDDGEEIPIISVGNGKGSLSKIRKGVLVTGSRGKTQVVKTVSFDENGNVYRVYGNSPEPTSGSEDDDSTNGSSDENGKRKENGCDDFEEIKCVPKESECAEEKAQSENEESSSHDSDGETSPRKNVSHLGRNEYKREFQLRNGRLMFSAPLPLKMESRADL